MLECRFEIQARGYVITWNGRRPHGYFAFSLLFCLRQQKKEKNVREHRTILNLQQFWTNLHMKISVAFLLIQPIQHQVLLFLQKVSRKWNWWKHWIHFVMKESQDIIEFLQESFRIIVSKSFELLTTFLLNFFLQFSFKLRNQTTKNRNEIA